MYVSFPWEGSLLDTGIYPDVRPQTTSGLDLPNTVVKVTYPGGKQLDVFQFLQEGYGIPAGVAVTPPARL